jgi:S-adenosyl-L-methionine hydrolase (adenosine-forming)
MPKSGIVTLLSDFGLRDPFVGVMKASVLSRFPSAALVDLTHDIEPGRVADAAFWLAQAAPWFPAGTVHLAAVDPGVGTSREALVVRAFGHIFVGPDNGLFEVVRRKAPSFECRRVELARVGLVPPSRTFHGRDVFGPLAGLFAASVLEPEAAGPLHEPLATRGVPVARAVASGFEGEVVVVDRFGNLVTNVEPEADPAPGSLEVEILGRTLALAGTYGELPRDGLGAVLGSFGQLEVVARDGSAARALGAQRGTPLRVHRIAP